MSYSVFAFVLLLFFVCELKFLWWQFLWCQFIWWWWWWWCLSHCQIQIYIAAAAAAATTIVEYERFERIQGYKTHSHYHHHQRYIYNVHMYKRILFYLIEFFVYKGGNKPINMQLFIVQLSVVVRSTAKCVLNYILYYYYCRYITMFKKSISNYMKKEYFSITSHLIHLIVEF